MAKKLKMTVFTKFLIFLIFAAPAAYIGASYYNGQDGVQNFKNIFSKDKTETPSVIEESQTDEETKTTTNSKNPVEFQKIQKELSYYKQRTADLEKENNQLKKEIWELQQKK